MTSDPYPAPRVIGENYYYASLLLEDYAGLSGELTAINQYIYHYITLQDCYPAIAKLARQVAIEEMKHFELLGKTIQLLGMPPLARCEHPRSTGFWSAQYVYYGHDIYAKLSANIQHEADAIRLYRYHQKLIDDPYIHELLERIISDEERHFNQFTKCRDTLYTKHAGDD